jgi:hypothetical protein
LEVQENKQPRGFLIGTKHAFFSRGNRRVRGEIERTGEKKTQILHPPRRILDDILNLNCRSLAALRMTA